MRFMLRSLVLTSAALCATAAFASDKTVVNVPFNFESHGHAFPAGKYEVSLGLNTSVLILSNANGPSLMWVASPADGDSDMRARLTFDDAGYTHELRTVQLGNRVTSVLDAPAKHHNAGSSVVTVGGQ